MSPAFATAVELHAERLELLERRQRVLDRLVLAAVLLEGLHQPAGLCMRSCRAVRNFTAWSIKAAMSCWLALRREALGLVVSVLAWPLVAALPVVLVVGSLMRGTFLGVTGWGMGAAISPCGDSMRTASSAGGMAEPRSSGIQTYLRSNALAEQGSICRRRGTVREGRASSPAASTCG